MPNATAEFDVASGVSFHIGQSPSTPDLVSASSGLVAVESTGVLTIGETLDNSGSIVAHGVLDLAGGAISGAGQLKVGGSGTVTLENGRFSGGILKIKPGGV